MKLDVERLSLAFQMDNKTQYTEENIRSLDWKEHIRMRPGMYIGKFCLLYTSPSPRD